ncbi:MAG TPA: sugar-binding transcriptional regulator [Acidobacteriaceae bacterium]|nr:sugar-binding transcriptional regulator [Acidobacteriaceae bacterium]
MAKIARMYYDQGMRQKEITDRLSIHQSTVSRLLQRAREANIVRISVSTPPGIFGDIEDMLVQKFGLKEAIVVETRSNEEHLMRDLGAAAGFFLQTSVKPGTIIGISSWSRTLFSMVDTLHSSDCGRGGKVVQILGGVGAAGTRYEAMQLAQRLAALISAKPVLLQAPALVGSVEARRVLMRDPTIRETTDLFGSVNLALVGIGSMEPSHVLVSSGNAYTQKEREHLRELGAVGDICFRFYDAAGKPIRSPLNQRVVGIELDTLKRIERVVGIAGGRGKLAAIRAALLSQRINVLITDLETARSLVNDAA